MNDFFFFFFSSPCFTPVCIVTSNSNSLSPLLYFSSPLQICGLTFFSKKPKNERGGNMKKLLVCLQAQKSEDQARQAHLACKIFQLQVTRQIRLPLQDSSSPLSKWIQNLQQFLSILPSHHLQRVIPTECPQVTENAILQLGLDVILYLRTSKICLLQIFNLFISVYSNFGLVICCKKVQSFY